MLSWGLGQAMGSERSVEEFFAWGNAGDDLFLLNNLSKKFGKNNVVLSDISSSKELFNKAKPHYKSALKQGGHDEKLIYTERKKPVTHTMSDLHQLN